MGAKANVITFYITNSLIQNFKSSQISRNHDVLSRPTSSASRNEFSQDAQMKMSQLSSITGSSYNRLNSIHNESNGHKHSFNGNLSYKISFICRCE